VVGAKPKNWESEVLDVVFNTAGSSKEVACEVLVIVRGQKEE